MTVPNVRIDILVFGASGFAGKYIVDELARVALPSLTWGVVGRSKSKLEHTLKQAAVKTGKDTSKAIIMSADVEDHTSLVNMALKAHVIINCVGPFCVYGERVVRACIEGKAHQLDVSGEPWFLENTQVKYHDAARDAGIYVVGSCGFESVPADLGIVFTKNNFDGDLNTVESFLDIGQSGNGATSTSFKSAVNHFLREKELPEIRKKIFSRPTLQAPPTHEIVNRSSIHYNEEVNGWCLIYPGTDLSVVNRTQQAIREELSERPVQYVSFFVRQNLWSLFGMCLFGIVFAVMTSFNFTASILQKYTSFFSAGIFTERGPTQKEIDASSFRLTIFGEGYSTKLDTVREHTESPDKKIVTRITGPDAGYVTSPITAVQCALCIIEEKNNMPSRGGVYTPAIAFRNTTIIDRLHTRGIKFEVVSK